MFFLYKITFFLNFKSLVTTNDHLLQEINKFRQEKAMHFQHHHHNLSVLPNQINSSNPNLTSLNNNNNSSNQSHPSNVTTLRSPSFTSHDAAALSKKLPAYDLNMNPNYNSVLNGRYSYHIVK